MSKKPELKDLPGVGPKLEDKLRAAGIKTVLNMSRASADKLAEKVEGLSESGAAKLIEAAQGLLPDTAPAKKPAKKAEAKPEKKKKAAPKEKPKKKAAPKKKKAPPKKKKKKPKVEAPLRVQNTDQRILRIAKRKKKHMPQFRHEQAHRWIRVSDSWRRLRGIDSATREKRKGRIFVEVRVHRPSEIENLDPDVHAVRIGATVGARKRQEIIAAADAKLLRILNPGRSDEIDEEDLFTDLDLEED